MIRIVMEMVTAMPENANALLIMSMPKIVQFPDVSSYSQSHYIEVAQEGVSSRVFTKKIESFFFDFRLVIFSIYSSNTVHYLPYCLPV